MAKIIQLCYLTTTRTQQDTNGKGDGKENKNAHKLITRLKMVPFGKDSIFFFCLFVGFANMDFSTLKK